MGITYKAYGHRFAMSGGIKSASTSAYLGDESARLRFYAKHARRRGFVTRMLASGFPPRQTPCCSEYFYAMEFVEGETLENLINRSGRLKVKLALEIATQLATGLAAVHTSRDSFTGTSNRVTSW